MGLNGLIRVRRGLTRAIWLLAGGIWGTSGGNIMADDRADVHSYARPDQARVKAVDLDLAVDFEAKVLRGSSTLTVERPVADAPLVLDTRGLVIERVTAVDGPSAGEPSSFALAKDDPILGSALTVSLPPGTTRVKVNYHTTEKATALQWLDAKGTAGGKAPFLFTQSEAIHARSWIPLQDSPAVRVTYRANVTVSKGLTAVMSADRLEGGEGTFRFEMREPVAPYLIALAVGDLAFRPMGPRTGVWAEPSVVDRAAKEFADTESMVKAVEARYGPYRWGRYDILVLPPSFPFGGMENPKLTFATPTVIAGDRSLVSLVAHELAHSWSGNLVTNATWRDFWLNEGFTTYIERRTIEDVFGEERAAMERVLGGLELEEDFAALPLGDQVLHLDLSGRDPDEGMTQVAYEKGALFLQALEEAFGRERFDAFLKGYFNHFAFRSIKTGDFVAYLKANLFPLDPKTAKGIDLDAWLEKPGLPAGAPKPGTEVFARIDAASKDWLAGRLKAEDLHAEGWSTQEWLRFLRSFPTPLSVDKMAELDRVYRLTDRGNAEIVCQWLVAAMRNRYAPADMRLNDFLTTIGRRKFLMPLYTELIKTPEGAETARTIYQRAKGFYHPIARDSVEKLLASKGK